MASAIVVSILALLVLTAAATAQGPSPHAAAGRRFSADHDCAVCEAAVMQVEAAWLTAEARRKGQPLPPSDVLAVLEEVYANRGGVFDSYGVKVYGDIPLFVGPGLDGYEDDRPLHESGQWSRNLALRAEEVLGEYGEEEAYAAFRKRHQRLAPLLCNRRVASSFCNRNWAFHTPHNLPDLAPSAAQRRAFKELQSSLLAREKAGDPEVLAAEAAEAAAVRRRREARQEQWEAALAGNPKLADPDRPAKMRRVEL